MLLVLSWGAFLYTPTFAATLLEANFTDPPSTEDPRWIHSQNWDQDVSLSGGIASYDTIDRGVNASIITAIGAFNNATSLRARMRVIADDGFNGGGTSMILIRNGYQFVAGIVSDNAFHAAAVNALSFGGITQSFAMDTSVFHEYRLVITDVATGLYDIYADDVLVLPNNQAAFIGAGFDGQAQFGDNEATADAQAELDWVRVEDGAAPTPPDVLIADANTRGLWYFNHAPGTESAWDASANANHGTLLTGAPFQLDPAVSWIDSRPGYNQCIMAYYNSGSDFSAGPIEVPQGSNMSLAFWPGTDMTIEFWMYPALIDGSSRYILTKYTGADYHVTFSNGNLSYAWNNAGWFSVTDTTDIPANEWTHVAITVDRSGSPAEDIISFYINQALSSTHSTPHKGGNPNSESLWIMGAFGGSSLANCFLGRLDEIRISDVIRDYAGNGTITAAEASAAGVELSYTSRRNGLYAIRRAESLDGVWATSFRTLGDATESAVALPAATAISDNAYFDIAEATELFTDVTSSAGLSGSIGHYFGGSWGDFNSDGRPDFFSRSLFRNVDGSSFAVLPISALNVGDDWGGPWGDYDNDGDPDLLALGFSNGGQWFVKLLRNESGTSFVDDSAKLPSLPMTQVDTATWVDVDNDGDLDLYLGGGEPAAGYQPDAVLQNNNNGASFSVIFTTPAPHRPARGSTACDFDEDGDMDIFVSNYRLEPNLLWINNGSGSFTEQAATYGVAGDGALGAWGHTIGSNWVDLNNDGRIDLFVGNFSHPADYQDRPQFLTNLGPAGSFHFQDDSAIAGLAWRESYANPGFADFDNDTWLDFFYTCIYPADENVLCRNNGDGTFSEIPSEAFVDNNYQTAWADYDGDGDPDLLTSSRLLRNECNVGHWLKVKLAGNGTTVNKSAIGAQVRISINGKTLTRQVEGSTGGHAGNQNDLTLHFGLATHSDPVDLGVRWPDGTTETVNDVAVDQTITVQK